MILLALVIEIYHCLKSLLISRLAIIFVATFTIALLAGGFLIALIKFKHLLDIRSFTLPTRFNIVKSLDALSGTGLPIDPLCIMRRARSYSLLVLSTLFTISSVLGRRRTTYCLLNGTDNGISHSVFARKAIGRADHRSREMVMRTRFIWSRILEITERRIVKSSLLIVVLFSRAF